MAQPRTPAARPTAGNVDPAQPMPTSREGTPLSVNDASPNLLKENAPTALPGNGAAVEPEMITVRTKGEFMLMDPWSFKHIARKPVEVPVTTFITDELEPEGKLERA